MSSKLCELLKLSIVVFLGQLTNSERCTADFNKGDGKLLQLWHHNTVVQIPCCTLKK